MIGGDGINDESNKMSPAPTNVATVNRTSSVSSAGNTPKTMVTAKLPGTVTITGTLAGRQVKTAIKVVDATLSIVRDSHQDTPSREDDVQVPVTGKNVDATSGERASSSIRRSPQPMIMQVSPVR